MGNWLNRNSEEGEWEGSEVSGGKIRDDLKKLKDNPIQIKEGQLIIKRTNMKKRK